MEAVPIAQTHAQVSRDKQHTVPYTHSQPLLMTAVIATDRHNLHTVLYRAEPYTHAHVTSPKWS